MRFKSLPSVLVLYVVALIAAHFSNSWLFQKYYDSKEPRVEPGNHDGLLPRTTGATQSSSVPSTSTPTATNHSFMIVDCIMYNGEPIVPYRLEILYNVVDRFYITEGTVTHTKIKKAALFKDINSDVFKPYQDKIVWNVLEMPSNLSGSETSEWWRIERYMRNNITDCLKHDFKRGAIPKDFVIINTDADEIPHPKVVEQFKPGNKFHSTVMEKPASLNMEFFFYNFNWHLGGWNHGHTLPGKQVVENKVSFNSARLGVDPMLDDAGWHLSYAMTVDGIVRKLQSTPHQEYNTPFHRNRTRIRECMENGIDLFAEGLRHTHFDYKQLPLPLQKFHENVCKIQNVDPQTGKGLVAVL